MYYQSVNQFNSDSEMVRLIYDMNENNCFSVTAELLISLIHVFVNSMVLFEIRKD